MSNLNEDPAPRRLRRKRRNNSLLILAAGIFLFGVAAGTLYYALRPVTLRIAVGPAGSEDQKLVQLMAQTFAREGAAVRLSPITTEGASESIALFAAGKADLAVARGDLNLPANAESVAILRKNVVVLWAPSGLAPKGSKKATDAEDQKPRRTRRTSRRRNRANASQRHVAARDPDRIRHQSGQGDDHPVRHQPDCRDGARSEHRRVHGGRPAQQQAHRGGHHGDRKCPGRAEISSDRRLRGDRPETSDLRDPRKSPAASSRRRRRGPKTRSRRSASTI